ncbi:FAD-dependent monooxygenase [Fluviibacterium sp. DFM31]|uniref:FAD-dependent monooxygenase n=1 Tax=Meridianimarinicoccus marinus TaxID=3231483 RepID=A0ABV3L5A1_9RHOB
MLIGQDITVIGAGIGGLTAALALAMRGARVEVLEQAAEVTEVGAGIQVSPNGMAVLDALGVADALIARSVRGQKVTLRDGLTGKAVVEMDLTGLKAPQPWLFVHRADLVDVLHAACIGVGVEIRLNTGVETLLPVDGGVQLEMASGETLTRPLVIAADGVRSKARAVVAGEEEPAFTGQTAWRVLVPQPEAVAPEVQVFLGPGRHMVAYPLRDGRTMNVVAVKERDHWVGEGWTQQDYPETLQAAFSDFAPEAQALLADIEEVYLWGLFKRPVAQVWSLGRLALLGDAAHATLPFLAQGACMAIEDAWVLADALANAASPETGLAAYETRRIDRCRRIVAGADTNARAYHLGTPLRSGALAALKLGGKLAPKAALNRFDWLHGHDVTKD